MLGRYHADGSTVGSLAHFGEPAEGWAAGLVIVVAELGFQCLQERKKNCLMSLTFWLMIIFKFSVVLLSLT